MILPRCVRRNRPKGYPGQSLIMAKAALEVRLLDAEIAELRYELMRGALIRGPTGKRHTCDGDCVVGGCGEEFAEDLRQLGAGKGEMDVALTRWLTLEISAAKACALELDRRLALVGNGGK